MFCQASGIIASNIYRKGTWAPTLWYTRLTSGIFAHSNSFSVDDSPRYKRGNRQLLAILCMNIVLYLLVKTYYVFRNKQRDRKWASMTEEERLHYLATTKDKGNKRLDFRFQH